MGLKVVGHINNRQHTVYKKTKRVYFSWKTVRFFEKVSRVLFPILEAARAMIWNPYKLVKRSFFLRYKSN